MKKFLFFMLLLSAVGCNNRENEKISFDVNEKLLIPPCVK